MIGMIVAVDHHLEEILCCFGSKYKQTNKISASKLSKKEILSPGKQNIDRQTDFRAGKKQSFILKEQNKIIIKN